MKVFETVEAIRNYRNTVDKKGNIIGLVPTMGALHEGHLSLVKAARKECNIVIASIFVNPTQFNDPEDLKNYPRTTNEDVKMLSANEVDALFIPDIHDIYPHPDKRVFDFGMLEKVMEGKYRPGHFNGVAQVVSIFFDIVKPHRAYFGQKDFQQLAIIKELTKKLNMDVDIVACPTIRENNGLAMSSRNELLNDQNREDAGLIFETLKAVIEQKPEKSPSELVEWGRKNLQSHPEIEVEYFKIVNTENLQPARKWGKPGEQIACVAIKINNVRLIDNMIFP